MLSFDIPVKLSEGEILERQQQELIGPMILFQERQLPHVGQSNNDVNMSDCRISNQDQNKSSNLRSNENSFQDFNRNPQFRRQCNSFEKEQQITSHFSLDLQSSDYNFLIKSEYIKLSSLSSYLYRSNTNKHFFFSKVHNISLLPFFFSHLMIFLYLPFTLAFNLSVVPLYFFICIKFLEIFVLLNSQIGDESEERIISIYFNSQLVFDLIYIFGLILIAIMNQSYFEEKHHQSLWIVLLIVLFSQQKRYNYLAEYVKNYFNWHRRIQSVASFILMLFFKINLLVCFWNHFILQDTTVNSYIVSMFNVISIISMNSTFNPKDNTQMIASIVVMICGIWIYVQVIRFFALQFYFQDNLKAELDKYFQRNTHIDIKLKNKICREVYGEQNSSNDIVISKLSPNTIRELQKEQRYSLLQEHFTEYSLETLNKLVDCCEDIWCTPGQTVFNKNVSDDSSLYLIRGGQFTVQVKPKQILKTLNVGQSFGEFSFYSQQPRTATIICKEQGHLLKVTRLGFLRCLSYNENQIFCFTKDRLLFQSINPHNQKCYCCDAMDHLIVNCPKLTYQPKRSRIIREINVTHLQPRLDIMRKRKRRSINAIINTLDKQSVDVDLFQYMFSDKWNLQKIENNSSHKGQEQQQGQEFQTESLYLTESVVGEIHPQISNATNQLFQDSDRDLAQFFERTTKIKSENLQKIAQQQLKIGNSKMVKTQKSQLKSLQVIPEQVNSQFMSINDDIYEYTSPEIKSSQVDQKKQHKNYQKSNSVMQESQQHIPMIFKSHNPFIVSNQLTSFQSESQKQLKSIQSFTYNPISSIQLIDIQKSRLNYLSNLNLFSNLYNQYQFENNIENDFDKQYKFEIYYPEYNYDPQIQGIQNSKQFQKI